VEHFPQIEFRGTRNPLAENQSTFDERNKVACRQAVNYNGLAVQAAGSRREETFSGGRCAVADK